MHPYAAVPKGEKRQVYICRQVFINRTHMAIQLVKHNGGWFTAIIETETIKPRKPGDLSTIFHPSNHRDFRFQSHLITVPGRLIGQERIFISNT